MDEKVADQRRFTSYDGTELAYRVVGTGPTLVCLPGGPGQAVDYLGDLGGLSEHRTLVLLDNRGTGASAAPADPATYRVDRLVDDVEALRRHLHLDRIDLLGHSAAGGVGMLYAAAHPERLHRLLLVCPSLRAAGLPSDLDVETVIAARAGEPWHAEAVAALHGTATTPDELRELQMLSAPLLYGRWDARTRAHMAAGLAGFAPPATDGFYAGFEPDFAAVRARLASLAAPVLVVAGEHDIWPTPTSTRRLAALFSNGSVAVQPGAGHFPWVDDAAAFVDIVTGFLGHH